MLMFFFYKLSKLPEKLALMEIIKNYKVDIQCHLLSSIIADLKCLFQES